MRRVLGKILFGVALSLFCISAQAKEKAVIIAYHTGIGPYAAAVASGEIAKKTGRDIEFRQFNSGADIFAAIASGDVQVGDVGSSPLAAVTSRGLDVKAIYVTAVAGDNDALVVRNEITSADQLKGKKIAAAPVSTNHYQLLGLLRQENLTEKDTQVIAIPQAEIVAAWKRGDIDGGHVWDPALSELKKDGHILLTAREIADRGDPFFETLVVSGAFAENNREFLTEYVRIVDEYLKSLRDDKGRWSADSPDVKAIASLLGGTPAEQAERLAGIASVPLKEQVSAVWLEGGLAKEIRKTAEFLKEQKKISNVGDDYSKFVDPSYAAAVAKSEGQ